jgi:signal transduction histidine kinase/PAS domain-containing protein
MEPARGQAESLDQLALLYAMVDHIQRARRAEDVYQEAVDGMLRILSVDRSALLVHEGRDGMQVKAWGGLSTQVTRALQGYAPWPQGERDPGPMVIDDLTDSRSGQPVYDALRSAGLRTLVWVPLLHRGRLMGELLLGRTRMHAFEPAEIRLAEVIAGHVAFSIWRARSDEDQAELLRRFEAERSVLDSVVSQMPAGVLLADVPSGRIVTCNSQVAAIWGKTLRHAGQVSDYALWGGLDSDGRPLPPERWPLARSVEHGETVRGEEILIERPDGSRRAIRMSSAPVVDSRGRQLAAVATVFDVTGERQEERRKAFLEAATQRLNVSIEMSATLDALADVVVAECGDWCVLYRPEEDGRFRSVRAVHRDPERDLAVAPFREAAVGDDSAHPVVRALDERSPLLFQGVGVSPDVLARSEPALQEAAVSLGCTAVLVLPLVARDQELGALAVVRAEETFSEADLELLTEFSRRASLALENAHLYERARAADRAKSTFLAVMSHEFRTPLSAILGYADILTAKVHGDLTTKQQTHLERVKASVRHLSHLVDEILSFASMESGRERVVRSRTDLRAVTADAMAIMEPIAEAAGLALQVDLPEGRVEARTDASKVRQIIINLVSNGLKYTPEGGVAVRLHEEGELVRWEVTDTGPGIAPEHLEQVFEPFWQVDQSDGRRITGTGLGLAVARRLARLLGGDLTLKSRLGEGSCFTLVLPLEAPGVAADRPS